MTTEPYMNVSEIVTEGSVTTGDEPALWFIVIDRIQLTMTVVGAVINTMTVITLQKNGAGFQSCVSYNFELMTKLQRACELGSSEYYIKKCSIA